MLSIEALDARRWAPVLHLQTQIPMRYPELDLSDWIRWVGFETDICFPSLIRCYSLLRQPTWLAVDNVFRWLGIRSQLLGFEVSRHPSVAEKLAEMMSVVASTLRTPRVCRSSRRAAAVAHAHDCGMPSSLLAGNDCVQSNAQCPTLVRPLQLGPWRLVMFCPLFLADSRLRWRGP